MHLLANEMGLAWYYPSPVAGTNKTQLFKVFTCKHNTHAHARVHTHTRTILTSCPSIHLANVTYHPLASATVPGASDPKMTPKAEIPNTSP